jgi:hypothetical protein
LQGFTIQGFTILRAERGPVAPGARCAEERSALEPESRVGAQPRGVAVEVVAVVLDALYFACARKRIALRREAWEAVEE